MIKVKKEGIVLEKTSLDFESEGVLNPGTIREGDCVHLFYRAVSKDNNSSIGYCRLRGPLEVEYRLNKPLLSPQLEFESHGMEDPRIVKIGDWYYLTYTAYNGINALGALAISQDLHYFDKMGLIVPQITYDEFSHFSELKSTNNEKYFRYNTDKGILEHKGERLLVWDKDVIFFPRKINRKFYFLHHIRPDVQIVVAIDKLTELTIEFWENYFIHLDDCIVLSPKYPHEVSYIGGGCPPVETENGWLIIYHGVHDTLEGFVYSACAALMDLQNPMKEISRLPYPLFKPEMEWELTGEVNNICYPTGTALFDDTLYIYYGAADERIACASVSLSGLLKELMSYSHK